MSMISREAELRIYELSTCGRRYSLKQVGQLIHREFGVQISKYRLEAIRNRVAREVHAS